MVKLVTTIGSIPCYPCSRGAPCPWWKGVTTYDCIRIVSPSKGLRPTRRSNYMNIFLNMRSNITNTMIQVILRSLEYKHYKTPGCNLCLCAIIYIYTRIYICICILYHIYIYNIERLTTG